MTDLAIYRASEAEKARTADLLKMLPTSRASALDLGAREGFFSQLLAERFQRVTALDLSAPAFNLPGVSKVAADATMLPFRDEAFDCVFCAEVLEHVPNLQQACAEISRVARHEVIIGVPYRQDLRAGRATCRKCLKINPPWGHVHSFRERQLPQLFPQLKMLKMSFVGSVKDRTNFVSARLMDWAGNPWGIYDEEKQCRYCGAPLAPPNGERSLASRLCAVAAVEINRAQEKFTRPHANWIHVLLAKS